MTQTRSVDVAIGCGLAAAVFALVRLGGRKTPDSPTRTHIDTARTFNRSSALLALSVLTDSAMEHYRGSFDNPAMYTPLVVSTLSLFSGLHGDTDPEPARPPGRD